MKQLTWDEYYEKFYDLSPSTQKSYSYRLSDFGSADEVFEVIQEFAFDDEKFASKFTEKALNAGVHFTPEQVLEMTMLIEKSVLSKMAETAVPNFNKDELGEIYMLIDDESFKRISKKSKIDIFADDEPDDNFEEMPTEAFELFPKKKPGLFSTLFAAFGMIGEENNRSHKHNGKCNGDCANCPPHYGYRYGRWYYGHHHQYGCEFGGNKGL